MTVRAKHKKYKPRKKVGGNEVGAFRRNHQDTAIAAAYRIEPVTGEQRTFVYETLCAHPKGLTDEEICAITGLSAKSENPRRWELVKKGHVIDSGKRRLTVSGCKAIVWKAIKEGMHRDGD